MTCKLYPSNGLSRVHECVRHATDRASGQDTRFQRHTSRFERARSPGQDTRLLCGWHPTRQPGSRFVCR